MAANRRDSNKTDSKPPEGTAPDAPPPSDELQGREATTEAPGTPPPVDIPSEYPNTAPGAGDEIGMGAQAEKRLSPKIVMEGNLSDAIIAGTIKLPSALYTLIGRAANIRTGESDFGPWAVAVGEFEATRISDNKVFVGLEAHIPGPAGDLLITELRRQIVEPEPQTEEEKKRKTRRYKSHGEIVDVAVMVGIRKAARAGGQPYEFTVQSLVPIKRSDALAALRQKALGAMAALPKPAPAPVQAALPAPDAKP
jgi:hypothetical protein